MLSMMFQSKFSVLRDTMIHFQIYSYLMEY